MVSLVGKIVAILFLAFLLFGCVAQQPPTQPFPEVSSPVVSAAPTATPTPAPTISSPPGKMSGVEVLNLSNGNPDWVHYVQAAFIEPNGDFAHFYMSSAEGFGAPGKQQKNRWMYKKSELIKMRLSDFKKVSTLRASGYPIFSPKGDFVYLVGGSRIVKVRLSDYAEVKTLSFEDRIMSIGLRMDDPSGEMAVAGVVDAKGEYGYFVTVREIVEDNSGSAIVNNATIEVIKVRLSDFTLADSMELVGERDSVMSSRVALIDASGKFAYFDVWQADDLVTVSKIRLDDFTKTGEFVFNQSVVGEIVSSAIDPKGEYAYLGIDALSTTGQQDKILKIRLSDMTEQERIRMPFARGYVKAMVVEPNGEYAYWSVVSFMPEVKKIRLRDFKEDDFLSAESLPIGEARPNALALDPSGKFVYVGTEPRGGAFDDGTTGGVVLKIRLK